VASRETADRYVLGIDVGTASSKAVLCRTDGAIVGRAQRPHRTSYPRPGWAEHDADAVCGTTYDT
jgi:xylulokinase